MWWPRAPELIRDGPSTDWGGARPLWTHQPLQQGEGPIRGRQGLLGFQIPGRAGAVQLHIQATLLQQAIGDAQILILECGKELAFEGEGDVLEAFEVGLQGAPYLE